MVGTISPLPLDLHRMLKKPVAKVFSMSNMVTFEGFVNSSVALFLERIDQFYTHGQICDLSSWMEMSVYDVLRELTFSKRYGFLEAGKDVDNIISDVEKHF